MSNSPILRSLNKMLLFLFYNFILHSKYLLFHSLMSPYRIFNSLVNKVDTVFVNFEYTHQIELPLL